MPVTPPAKTRRATAAAAALAALLCLPLTAYAAGIYKRVDETGKLEYTDKNLSDSSRITRRYLASRHIPPRDHAPPSPEFVAVAAACENQKDRLRLYRSATKLYARDPGNNRVPLSDRQRRLMIAETELEVQKLCRPRAAEQLIAEYRQRLAAEAETTSDKGSDTGSDTASGH